MVNCVIAAVTWSSVLTNHRRSAFFIPHFTLRITHYAIPHFTHSHLLRHLCAGNTTQKRISFKRVSFQNVPQHAAATTRIIVKLITLRTAFPLSKIHNTTTLSSTNATISNAQCTTVTRWRRNVEMQVSSQRPSCDSHCCGHNFV